MTTIDKLSISKIRMDGGTQPRAVLDQQVVQDYADAMTDGAEFPPVIIYYDGTDHWLADGFHRVNAAIEAEIKTIDAEIRQGTKREAILYSVGANKTHGLPRTNADKRRAVSRMFEDATWAKWSDREIAKKCGVGNKFVSEMRNLTVPGTQSERTYTTRHGTIATMETAGINQDREPRVRALASEIGEDSASQSSTVVVDKSTGEILDDAEVITTRTSTKSVPRGSFEDGSIIIETVKTITEQIKSVEGLKPKRTMTIEVTESLRGLVERITKLISRIEKEASSV